MNVQCIQLKDSFVYIIYIFNLFLNTLFKYIYFAYTLFLLSHILYYTFIPSLPSSRIHIFFHTIFFYILFFFVFPYILSSHYLHFNLPSSSIQYLHCVWNTSSSPAVPICDYGDDKYSVKWNEISPTGSALQRLLRPIEGAADAQAASRQSRRRQCDDGGKWQPVARGDVAHVASTEVSQLQQQRGHVARANVEQSPHGDSTKLSQRTLEQWHFHENSICGKWEWKRVCSRRWSRSRSRSRSSSRSSSCSRRWSCVLGTYFSCVQRADGCLYPIAAMPLPRHSSPPAPFPLTHARVISVFLSLSLFSLLTCAAICGDRSGVWDRDSSKNGRKRRHSRRYDTNTIAKTCPWGASNSYSLLASPCAPPSANSCRKQLSLDKGRSHPRAAAGSVPLLVTVPTTMVARTPPHFCHSSFILTLNELENKVTEKMFEKKMFFS